LEGRDYPLIKKGGKKFPPAIPPILPLDKIEKPVRMDTSNKKRSLQNGYSLFL
jgi:hypothetical protein